MTDLLHDVDAPSDAELISRVRGGDVAAYGDLFARHVDAAKRLSRQLVRGPDADDLVSDAFAKVLSVLQGGGGPDVAFRAYLLTAVRRLHVDRIRSGSRLQTSDDMEAFDAGVPFQDTAVAAFESGAAAKAFASLPERWQLVLWHLEVEGQKPADIAPLLGMSPNSVSALAYRAREGLRQAFLTMHLNDISETDCRWVNEHLGAYVRNGLAKRDGAKVRAHLDECRRCTAMYLELTEVNSNLAAIIAPLLLGAAAAGYLASAGTAAGGLGISVLFGRVRDVVAANTGVATAGAVAAGVAAVATAGILLLPSSVPETVVGADRPIATESTPASTGGPSAGSSNDGSGDRVSDPKQDDEPSAGAAATSPAAVTPSVLPSPSELPGIVTVGDGTGTGGQPGTAAPGGGESSPGGGASSPGDGTTTPSDPTTTPSDPTTTPSEPTPTEPSPTTPSPTEPSPTTPSPTTPGPTTPPPTDPPPVSYTVQVSGARIENGAVSFDLTGDPLPPTVYLQLESPPAGVTFDPLGSSTCVRVGDLVAQCTTAPPTSLVLAPLARAVAMVTTSDPVHLSMPLAGEPERDADVTISLSAPRDTVLKRVTLTYDVAEPAPTADVSLSLPPAVTTDDVLHYAVEATLTGIPDDYAGDVSFTLDSPTANDVPRATFAAKESCAVSADGLTLTCTGVTNGSVALDILVKDNSVDTEISITLGALHGFTDPTRADNTDSTVLKVFRPAVDVVLSLTTNPTGNSGMGTATVEVAGAPVEGATVTATYLPDGLTVTEHPSTCDATQGLITCTKVANGTALAFEVALTNRPERAGIETISFTAVPPSGYDESDPSDNSGSMDVDRQLGGNGDGDGDAGSVGETVPQESVTSLTRIAADSTQTTSPSTLLRKTGLSSQQEQPTQEAAPAPRKALSGAVVPVEVPEPNHGKHAEHPRQHGAEGKGDPHGHGPVAQIIGAVTGLLP